MSTYFYFGQSLSSGMKKEEVPALYYIGQLRHRWAQVF